VERRVRYAKAGTVNIAYQVVGDGPIDLVFAQGWATHLDLAWEIPDMARFLEGLASFCRLIVFDKRGTGLSDRISAEALPTLDERMSDLLAVMDAAGSEQAVLFGTLGGAAMCGLFAASYPERTRALVLYGAFGKLSPTTGLLSRLADSTDVALERIEREWGNASVGLDSWAPSLLADEPQAEAYLRLLRSSLSPAAARMLMDVGFRVDWVASMPAIRVPTLVLHRSGDITVPAAQGREVADSIAGARYVEFPGIDHLPWVGDQGALLDEVRAFVRGLAPLETRDRILTTILSTDIVGSTATAARLGDRAWRDLLGEHHRAVRRELGASNGVEIDTAGDGFLATFDVPANGIRCARSIADATSSIGLDIRAGLHTGEVEVTDDGIQGIAVHVAARVAALGGAREVLVSNTVRELASGAGFRFVEHGRHELRGVPGEWVLYRAEPAEAGSSPG
jgi:class 3 adenylate cyclase/pimeloyl-ACP methyl ester carboxylesterase